MLRLWAEGIAETEFMEGKMWNLLWTLAVVVVSVSGAVEGKQVSEKENWIQRAADQVKWLPGQPPVVLNQWAGYVNVGEDVGRYLFYFLSESPKNASGKPLVLWLNGGPGCSSLGVGWALEMGPFRVRENGTGLETNTHSWVRYANVLFLETPVGVGFSYSDDPKENHSSGDSITAEDNYMFLLRWLDRFPEYKDRDLYITGESYAGHYIPQLASLIHQRNRDSEQKINLKGMMVGNPSTDQYYDSIGTIDFWLAHSMISPQTHDQFMKVCNFTNCCSPQCNEVYNYAQQVEIGGIDYYAINALACNTDQNGNPLRRRLSQAFKATTKNNPFLGFRAGYDPCVSNSPEIYFNRKDVQEALHANVSGEIPYNWTSCSMDLSWTDSATTVLPLWEELIAAGYKIWIYSGDNDAVVPVTGTIYAIESLNLPITNRWYAWYHKTQVAGRTQWYKGVTFATVRGAGHEVAVTQPGRFLALFKYFLAGTELPPDP